MFRILRQNEDLEWVPVNKAVFDDEESARVVLNALKRKIWDPLKIVETEDEAV